MNSLPDQLRALRDEAGITQTELAERLGSGYTKQVVSAIETGGRSIGIRMLEKWSTACGNLVRITFDRISPAPDNPEKIIEK